MAKGGENTHTYPNNNNNIFFPRPRYRRRLGHLKNNRISIAPYGGNFRGAVSVIGWARRTPPPPSWLGREHRQWTSEWTDGHECDDLRLVLDWISEWNQTLNSNTNTPIGLRSSSYRSYEAVLLTFGAYSCLYLQSGNTREQHSLHSD